MIEELPDLPFGLILNLLSYEDRFNLRRVCKKLKILVDSQVNRNLFLLIDCYPHHRYLFNSNELVYYSDSCRIPDLRRLISSPYKQKFRLIKKLAVYFKGYSLHDKFNFRPENWLENLKFLKEETFFKETWDLKINLQHLNYFDEVEHLEIKVILWIRNSNLKSIQIILIPSQNIPSDSQ